MARKSNLASMSVVALLKLRDEIGSVLSERASTLREELAALGGSFPRKKTRAGRKVRAKYRDPKTGHTWSGRGAPARWIAEYEKAGRKRDEFLINKSQAKKAKTKKAKRRGRKKGAKK